LGSHSSTFNHSFVLFGTYFYILIMNYKVKAFKIIHINENTSLEDYEREVPNNTEAEKERSRLLSIGNYTNITIQKISRPPN
jgi:hypothetical protein